VHWRTTPSKDTEPLPGVLVVGQIALWGRCIEHERGWRASHAYPHHLYVFAEDAALAATLRDRYLVPVEYGAKANELLAELPGAEDDEDAAAPASSTPQPKSRATMRSSGLRSRCCRKGH
jgi:hypothetical protein